MTACVSTDTSTGQRKHNPLKLEFPGYISFHMWMLRIKPEFKVSILSHWVSSPAFNKQNFDKRSSSNLKKILISFVKIYPEKWFSRFKMIAENSASLLWLKSQSSISKTDNSLLFFPGLSAFRFFHASVIYSWYKL